MKNQEIFDKAYLGLKSQGFIRSVSSGISCVYRGPEGRKCAVGWLIPDEKYDPKFDTEIWGFQRIFKEIRISISQQQDFLIEELRFCHDSSRQPETMRNKLHTIAKDFNLKIPQDQTDEQTADL